MQGVKLTLMEISCLNLYESPSEISLKHFWFGLNHSIIPFSESLLLFGPLSHYSDRVKIDSDQQFMKIHVIQILSAMIQKHSDVVQKNSEKVLKHLAMNQKYSEAFRHDYEVFRHI